MTYWATVSEGRQQPPAAEGIQSVADPGFISGGAQGPDSVLNRYPIPSSSLQNWNCLGGARAPVPPLDPPLALSIASPPPMLAPGNQHCY